MNTLLPPLADNAHPLVKFMAERLLAEEMPRHVLAERAGISPGTISYWWNAEGTLILQNLEAALGVLGYALKPVPNDATHYGPPRTQFKIGQYKMQCGLVALVERVTPEGQLFGSYMAGRMKALWNGAGRRIPVGGTDPTDLLPDSFVALPEPPETVPPPRLEPARGYVRPHRRIVVT